MGLRGVGGGLENIRIEAMKVESVKDVYVAASVVFVHFGKIKGSLSRFSEKSRGV